LFAFQKKHLQVYGKRLNLKQRIVSKRIGFETFNC